MADRQPFSLLPRSLRAHVGPAVALPDARKLTALRAEPDFPAVMVNGRWFFDPADVPAIAERLGLKAAAPAKPARRPRVSATTTTAAAA